MKIVLLQTGKTTDKNVLGIAGFYTERIKKYSAFDIATIPEVRISSNLSVQEQKHREGKKILKAIAGEDYVILLDERGSQLRTVEFSALLGKIFMISRKRIVFVIGGPWGVSEEVQSRADFRLSLSSMTFPHQLVRLLFLEQLYRAFTIIRGEQYHHE